MIKKFTRVVLTMVMSIGLITGCGVTEKTEAQKHKSRKWYKRRKRTIWIIHMVAKVY